MNTELIIGAIGLVFGGGGIGAILQVYLGKVKISAEQKQHDLDYLQRGFKLAVDVVTNQRDDALKLVQNMRTELDDMKLEIAGLKLASGFDPFPRWMVDLEGRYLYINACFEERILLPRGIHRSELIGSGHDRIWPDAFCKKLRELDVLARTRPDGRARAVVEITLDPDGVSEEFTVYKFPVRVHGVIVAYAGYIMPM